MLIVGALVRISVIVLLTGANALPQPSVAVQVSVIVPSHAGEALNVDAFNVPFIKQPPIKLLEKVRVDRAGKLLIRDIVIAAGAVIDGSVAGLTVIALDTEATVLAHASIAVEVDVTIPPQAPDGTCDEKVDAADAPMIAQLPVNPLLNGKVLPVNVLPHATVVASGAVIVGKAAGLTVIVLDTSATVLLQASIGVQVSVTVPPQAPGVAVKVLICLVNL